MTTFAAFASSFRFLNNATITDVATIITDFRSETVTNGSPAWTEPTSNNFKSPPDSVGRFFTVILGRVSATRLQFKILDQNQITIIDRVIDISGTTSVNYYTGQYHAWIESLVATAEIAWSGILDASPLTQGTYTNYVYGNSYRNSAGTIDGSGSQTGLMFMLDNGASTAQNRMRVVGNNVNGNAPGLIDAGGNFMYHPCEVTANMSGNIRWIGRAYQVWMVDSSIAVGSTKTIIIGNAGETGVFRVISGLTSAVGVRWAVRQS